MKYENDFYVSAVKIGKQAPRFSVEALHSKGKTSHDLITFDLDDYIDQNHWIVVYFYGQDFTDEALKTIMSFSNAAKSFHDNNAVLVAVSTDSIMAHSAWQEGVLGNLNHFHASDLSHKVSEAFGVLDELSGSAYPGFFIIEPSGVLKAMQVSESGKMLDGAQVLNGFLTLLDHKSN